MIDSRLHQLSVFYNIIDVSSGVTKVGLMAEMLTKGFSMAWIRIYGICTVLSNKAC